MATNERNASLKAWYSIKREIDKGNKIIESADTVRESRQGFRGTGAYQLNRIYSAEGVLTIGVGGPPVVGQ